ncbi:S-layer homology domain-containing protein [Paenibacillus sepulcri]|uniref:S-layer homology domain-containing protein n=1 Tax=Paenibacillus sepulcri TaxID=359917 RepID=A0ABS7BVN2_9BACL|nr:S-layer homology domain-containing protein [Paenibacillus sepulcri]
MSETGKQYYKHNSQQPKDLRGGEKKVMKKSLAVIVAGAMAFSMFASAAFAADEQKDLTALEKFNALKELGVFEGYPGGGAGLENEMTRAEFAKVLSKISNLTENASAANVYSDVSATHWAKGFIGAVTADGIMEGLGGGKFGPSGKVTIEQVAKVADEVAGLEQSDAAVSGAVSAWAKGYVAAAIQAGLIAELPSYKTNATREMLVNVTYDLVESGTNLVTVKSTKVIDDKNIEVTFSDDQVVKKTLDTALVAGQDTKVSVEYNGKTYEVTVKLDVLQATEAKQTGAKKITVNFNQPVSATDKTDLTYELKYSFSPYPVTAVYAEDGKSVVLTAAYLPAGDYVLTVKGSAAINLKVEAEAATKVDVTSPALQKADDQSLGVKLYNQFNEEMTTASPQITAYNSTKNIPITVDNGTVDLAADSKAALGDSIIVTAVYPAAGLSSTKTLKVMNGSAATSIKIGTVVPLTNETRISVSQSGLILPLTLIDQNGQTIKLPMGSRTLPANQNSFEYGGLYFYISDNQIVDTINVNSDGVVTFNTKGKSGTVYITVTNGATAASASTSVIVNGLADVKEFQLNHPGKVIVKGEDIVFPFAAVDSYGAQIAGKDLNLNNVKFVAGLNLTPGYPKVNAKGELVFNFAQTGTTTIYTFVNGLQQTSNVQLEVKDVAYKTAVNGIKDFTTTLEVGAKPAFDADNITTVDNYGRVSNVTEGTYTVKSSADSIVKYENGQLVAVAPGSATITVASSPNVAPNADKSVSNYTFTVNVVASSDVKTFAIDTVGTVFGKSTATDASNAYKKAITLVGKTASGTTVTLASNNPTFVTSTNEDILKVSSADSTSVYGLKAGTSTVAAYFNGAKVAEQAVTVSEDAPVVKTVELSADEYTTTVNGTVTVGVTVKDQYGVVLPAPFQILSSDSTIATASANSLVVTAGNKSGSATLTYVSSNGTQDTATIVVN